MNFRIAGWISPVTFNDAEETDTSTRSSSSRLSPGFLITIECSLGIDEMPLTNSRQESDLWLPILSTQSFSTCPLQLNEIGLIEYVFPYGGWGWYSVYIVSEAL